MTHTGHDTHMNESCHAGMFRSATFSADQHVTLQNTRALHLVPVRDSQNDSVDDSQIDLVCEDPNIGDYAECEGGEGERGGGGGPQDVTEALMKRLHFVLRCTCGSTHCIALHRTATHCNA